jgi:hypothetical protein
MRVPSKQKLFGLAAGSLIAACTVFGPVAYADGSGGDDDKDPKPPPSVPNIPSDPSEGLPVPIPGGGG